MRSIYTRTLLWFLGTVIVAVVAFFLVSGMIFRNDLGLGVFFQRIHRFGTEQAEEAWVAGGSARLQKYLTGADAMITGHSYLVDANGRDVLTGRDLSGLLRLVAASPGRPAAYGTQVVSGLQTQDGQFRLLTVFTPPRVDPLRLLPYLGILLFVAFLSWLLALNVVRPIRKLSETVDRFGRGDILARARTTRRDEIGDLARSFDGMAERIETLLAAERRLLMDVSHELRTPLTRLGFAAELARTAEDRDAAAARMKKEIAQLSSLVDSLLEVTRGEGDSSTRVRKQFSLASLVFDVVSDSRIEAATRNCEIVIRENVEVFVIGDEALLRSAIENIIRNAIRYSPENAAIDVDVTQTGRTASIIVRDSGPGVPPDMLAKIFQPFFRVDESRVNLTGGVGLGLSIASRAVRLHSGTIKAENANPGLRVTIEIPVSA